MDKRVEKTRIVIFKGFSELLKEKKYSKITIENILEKSKVSRSTFYAHYKSKEEVLESIARSLFGHVLSHSLKEEKTHDFSKSSILDYSHIVTHILYHLHDDKEIIKPIFDSDAKDIFISKIREEVNPLSEHFINEGKIKCLTMGDRLKKEYVTETFITLIAHWFKNDCGYPPETMSKYFFELIS